MYGKQEDRERKIKAILGQRFEKTHVSSILKHFTAAKGKYQDADWEGAISKSGKFVEATTKALMRFCGKTLPKTRHFHAGPFLRKLEQEPTSIDDTIRIVIPKSCLFVYEIASNRGARHDPDEVNPNEFEEIDGRLYVNIEGISAEKISQLILYGLYPKRVTEDSLRDSIKRHGFSTENARMACRRISRLCDIGENGMKLRGLGRQKAEEILNENRSRQL